MNLIDMEKKLNTACSVSKMTGYSLTTHSYLKSNPIWSVITWAGMFVLTLLKLYLKFYTMMYM